MPAVPRRANALAATSKIPVGSGMIFTGPQVVVTQPTAGEFKAFSAVCTHMGCIVNQISNGTIDCPCHGSQYSITTGDVVAGPAPQAAARQADQGHRRQHLPPIRAPCRVIQRLEIP